MKFDPKRTKAPAEHIRLAEELKTQRGRLVHPDALVDPLCPVSRQLRAGQEERQKQGC